MIRTVCVGGQNAVTPDGELVGGATAAPGSPLSSGRGATGPTRRS
jgi:hypothetical protein